MLKNVIAIIILLFTSSAIAETWTDKITMSGDLRVREETIKSSVARQDFNSRIRARLAAKAKVNEQMNVNLRLTTAGSTTATSSNDKLTNAEAKKNFMLDIANIEYKVNDKLAVALGKNPNSFYVAGKNEMIWDADLTIEGLTANYHCHCDSGETFLNLAASQVQDRTATAQDTTLLGAQYGRSKNMSDVKYTLALSSYNYKLVKGQAAMGGGFLGNTNDGTNYLNEYSILDLGGEAELKLKGLPFIVFVDFASNSFPSDKNKASIYGVRWGNSKEVHDWLFTYDYRKVEADAVLAAVNDSDFAGGGTDAKGHKFYGQYVVAENATLGLSYFANTTQIASGADNNYERWMLDLGVKF